jgi:hypothetical protein
VRGDPEEQPREEVGEGVSEGEEQLAERARQRELLEACFADPEQAKSLLDRCPDLVHCRDTVGETAFHYVVVEDRIDLAEILLAAGSDVNTQTRFGSTPLMDAVQCGYLDMTRWLIGKGANLETKDSLEETALVKATENDRAPLFDFLIGLPRSHPIDFYYDDLSAHRVHDDKGLVMRDRLLQLGLTARFG